MITVVGSINMDLVVGTERFPKQGETVLGNLYTTVPGGKGANQAVAAARLGGKVGMIGAVGTDPFGDDLASNLKNEGINTGGIKRVEGPSGIANILLSEGDNRIIVVPGANHELKPQDIDTCKRAIASSDLVVLQLEIPVPTVLRTLEIARTNRVPVILNPAPADGFTDEFLDCEPILTPNESEAAMMFGENWEQALEAHPNRLIVTLGKEGARYHDGERHVRVPGIQVNAVDTTGAGDTFNGALAVALAENMPMKDAIRFANAAASLSVEKFGAQGGMPARGETMERLRQLN
ncbi:ribokinase [Bhargavaea beijingensis]|uniref:Ribokinase n=1 Tax=Bhargavaea beijingensis TaxID=426756 RepID=A0A1G6ZVZ8_9BACL|nr:ribokinase [Bhargavaea beijingensis]MCW1927198.1 ribokinase [Bhargavaea beijingensis]RSK35669.1 ribokinase [Bhargavaea beijingensis]SDE06894.1 ribokinase [Bhargavaea beijingensis]